MKAFICIAILIVLTSCSNKKIVAVNIEVDRITIDNKLIAKKDFEEKLKITIDSLVISGLNKSMIDIHVTAEKNISEYEMSEIEKAVRRQGVTRDYFWIDKKQ